MAVLAYALPLLSLLAALLIPALAPRLGERVAHVSVAASLAMFLLAAGLFVAQLGAGEGRLTGLGIGLFSLYIDALSALMAFAVSAIGLVVHLFSVRYMRDDPGYARFFALLDGIIAVILLMVLAGDLLTLLLAWHLIGVLLYFLLGHDLRREPATRYAFWTLFTHRIGDLPLLAAVALLFHAHGTLVLPELFARIAAAPDLTTVLGLPLTETVGLLILCAAFAKSAQFPLHTWLPYTMDGPTPVSALMHAGIVNAGGFLINRFAPLFVQTDSVLQVAIAVGLVTTVLGSLMMLMQSDIKKALGYSTMGQMGYMIMGVTFLTPLALGGVLFFIVHNMVAKTNLFLIAGMVQQRCGTTDLKKTGGLFKKDPALSAAFLISAIGLAGLPPLSGFWAKFTLVRAGFEVESYLIIGVSLAVGIMTLFSMTKIWAEAFWKSAPEEAPPMDERPLSLWFWLPVTTLGGMVAALGLFPEPFLDAMTLAGEQLMNPQGYIDAVLKTQEGMNP